MWLKAGSLTNVDPSHGWRFDNAAGAQGAAVKEFEVALRRTILISDDLPMGRLV